MTFEEVYNYLCKERDNLNFESREDFNTEYGISKFQSLKDDNIPENIKRFAEDKFKVEEFEYDFMQIQKYLLVKNRFLFMLTIGIHIQNF